MGRFASAVMYVLQEVFVGANDNEKYPQMSQMDTDGGPQADGGGEQVLINDERLFTHNIFSAVFIKLKQVPDY